MASRGAWGGWMGLGPGLNADGDVRAPRSGRSPGGVRTSSSASGLVHRKCGRGRPRTSQEMRTGTSAHLADADGDVRAPWRCGRGRPRTLEMRTGASVYPGGRGRPRTHGECGRGWPGTVGVLNGARAGLGGSGGSTRSLLMWPPCRVALRLAGRGNNASTSHRADVRRAQADAVAIHAGQHATVRQDIARTQAYDGA